MFLQLLLLSTVASLELNTLMPVLMPVKHKGISSSLLKLKEKNVNNETRDSLLDIIKDAEEENAGALVACGQTKAKLDEEKIAIANSLVANGEEKTRLEEALAANGRAQTANAKAKTDFEASKQAFAATRTFMEGYKAVYPPAAYAEIMEVNDKNDASNDAAIADNLEEAVAIKAEEDAIKESLDKNAQELATLQTAQDANNAGYVSHDVLKEKLDKAAASIAKIKEVIEANSEEATAVPYEQVGGPGEFCSGARLWAGGSEGQTDCQNKCSGYNECRFYSFYNTSMQYCTLTTNCDERGETGNGKPIIMERNMEAVPVPGPYKFEVIKEACGANMITSAGQCKAAADALGIRWNSCCQRGNGPYGCVKRNQDNDVFFNGYAETTGVFKYDPRGLSAVCHQGPSSLLKITEKNIDMETRDDLLAIVDDAAKKNAAAVVANGKSKNKLEAEKVAIANSIEVILQEASKLKAALAANAEAQKKNEDMKADLLLDADAFAATRAFFQADPRRDPTGDMLKILEGQEATNAAAIKDNAEEADALLTTRHAIEKSLKYNAQALKKLRQSQKLNKSLLAQNAEEKIKLESTAAAINRIREVITRNSEKECWVLFPSESKCKKYPGVSGKGWTRDQTVGGVGVHHLATNEGECETRSRGWSNACGFSVQWAWRS